MSADRLRVLVGMPFAEALGGAERLLRTFSREARVQGLDLHVAFLARGPLEDELRSLGVRTHSLELGRFRDLRGGRRALGSLRSLIAEERPDAILSWLPRAHAYLAPAARLARSGAAVAWWQHHVPTGERFERVTTALPADAVLCSSEAAAEAQRALRPRRKCVVCHPGIDAVEPTPPRELEALRESLGIAAGATVLGISGRLVRWKGQDRFLRAVALLRDRGVDAHALVMGGSAHGLEPDWPGELERLVADLGLREHCTFSGHVEDPVRHLELLDLLVNASEAEPFGLTLVEAMAAGVPVVAADSAGPREIVRHGESGWLVPDASPEALAGGLQTLLDDAGLRHRLAEGGRARYAAEFTAAAMAGRAAEALRSLTRQRG